MERTLPSRLPIPLPATFTDAACAGSSIIHCGWFRDFVEIIEAETRTKVHRYDGSIDELYGPKRSPRRAKSGISSGQEVKYWEPCTRGLTCSDYFESVLYDRKYGTYTRRELWQASRESTPRSSARKDRAFLNGHDRKIGYRRRRESRRGGEGTRFRSQSPPVSNRVTRSVFQARHEKVQMTSWLSSGQFIPDGRGG